MNIFDLYPAPWVVDDNRQNHEGELTVFADNGEVVMCAGDMEDVEAIDMALAEAVASIPDLILACQLVKGAYEAGDVKPGGVIISEVYRALSRVKDAKP